MKSEIKSQVKKQGGENCKNVSISMPENVRTALTEMITDLNKNPLNRYNISTMTCKAIIILSKNYKKKGVL